MLGLKILMIQVKKGQRTTVRFSKLQSSPLKGFMTFIRFPLRPINIHKFSVECFLKGGYFLIFIIVEIFDKGFSVCKDIRIL
jgi:hypothetical protein